MIELIAIPLFMKGVDLLVEYAKYRIQNHTDRVHEQEIFNDNKIRRVIGEIEVASSAIKLYEDKMSSLIKQLEIHQGNLNKLNLQKAKWGEALVPSVIENSIADEENAYQQKAVQLSEVMERVAGQPLPKEITDHLNALI